MVAIALALLTWLLVLRPVTAGTSPLEDVELSTLGQEERLAAGRDVYVRQGCVGCHALEVVGAIAPAGPPLDNFSAAAAAALADPAYAGSADSAAAYLVESLREPELYITPGYSGGMPRYDASRLDGADLEVLTEMLLAGPGE